MSDSILNARQDWFRQLFTASPDPIWIIDGNRMVDCNEAAVRILGYPNREELLNTPPSRLSPPRQPDGEDSIAKAERMLAIARDKGWHRFGWRYTRFDAAELDAEVTLSKIDSAGGPMFQCAWRDVTERKQFERALRNAEARYRSFVWELPLGIVITQDGLLRQVNQTTLDMIGYPENELLGQPFLPFVAEADRPRVMDLHFRRMRGETVEPSYVVTMVRKDGEERFWQGFVNTIDWDGRPSALGSFIDITERKRTEMALAASQGEFRVVVEQSPLAMALVNQDGTIEYINRKSIETFGYLPEDIPHMDRWWALAYPDETYRAEVTGRWMGFVMEALANKHEIEKSEYRVTCKNGEVIIATIFGVWVADKVIVIFEDVTATKQQEQLRLEKETAHRDALVREVHHRIKNNLQSVAGLLQRELGKFLELDPRLETAISQINVIAVVHGLQGTNPNEVIRLREVIHNIRNTISSLTQYPVRLELGQDEESLAKIRISDAEAVSVALVLNELVLNAVKHAPRGGRDTTVTLSADDRCAQLLIRNALETAPDFNIDTAKGLGNGLSLVRSLLPEQGAVLTYTVDQEGCLLTCLKLTPPVVTLPLRKAGDDT